MRKVLSADKIFQHTGLKQKHETVWRLDQVGGLAGGWVGGWVGWPKQAVVFDPARLMCW